jgi:sterol desaturase/sphingolipid hydroxylase (fatty acid hydroxylase superfamily)
MAKNFVSNKDETVRMFESDFMEVFSRVHFSVPLFIYLPVVFYFMYRAVYLYEQSAITILTLIILGIAVWTLTEYTLHRFIFHLEFKSEFGARIHFIFHGVHHDYPNDSKRLVMPPSVSIPLAILFYYIFTLILGSINVAGFFVGFILGYLAYDMTHYAVHHFNMHNKFWLAIKNHHMKHHYMDSTKGFGVSSPVWDEVMGTNFPEKEIE